MPRLTPFLQFLCEHCGNLLHHPTQAPHPPPETRTHSPLPLPSPILQPTASPTRNFSHHCTILMGLTPRPRLRTFTYTIE